MAIEKIEIVVIGKDKGGAKTIDKQKAALQKLDKEGEKLGKTLLKATAIAAAFGIALKKAFDLGRAGAVVRQTTIAFETLMGQADAAMREFQDVSDGTVSKMEIMASVTTALAGTQGQLKVALQGAAPELLRIAKAASALNPALGDTSFVFQSLVRGIKRSSPLIIDNANIVLKLGDAYSAYADDLGVTVEELSAVDKQMALLQETLKGGNVLIDQAGDAAESAIDPFDRLSASAKDLGDALKADIDASGFVEETAKGVDALSKLVDEFDIGQVTVAFFATAIGKLPGEFAKSVDAALGLDAMIEQYNETVAEAVRRAENLAASQKLIEGGFIDGTRAQRLMWVEQQKAIAIMEREAAALGEAELALIAQAEALEVSTLAAENWIDTFERSEQVVEAVDSVKESLGELEAREKALTTEIQNFERAIGQTGAEAAAEVGLMQIELFALQGEIRSVTAAWDEQTKSMLFNMVQQRLAIDGFTVEELSALTKLAGPEGFGLIDQAAVDFIGKVDESAAQLDAAGDQSDLFVKDLQDLQTEFLQAGTDVEALGESIEALPETISIEVKFNVGNFPNIPGSNFGTGGQSTVGFHLGGHFIVPTGFPNDSFPIGVSSGEEVDVRRPGADDNRRGAGRGGGGAPSITFVYNPTISTVSGEEVQRAIAPFIESGFRQLDEQRRL